MQYLFITNDEKKNSNWFGKNLEGLHPLLQEEIHKIFRYDALDITTLYGFILFCKPQMETYQKYFENGEYLRSAEMDEEQNYNMIDGRINN